MIAVNGPSIFVNTKEGNVEIVSWESVVVRVSAEERTCKFGGKHQANIRIFLITIELVHCAAIKRNSLAGQSRLLALLFHALKDSAACICGLSGLCRRIDRGRDFRRDV